MNKNRIIRTLAIAALAAGALPASALADCPKEPQIEQMFQEFDGDTNYYFVAPGGTFEGKTVAETTGSTKIIAADHSVSRAGTKAALSMTTGSTVTTGAVCIDPTRVWARFLYRRNSANGSMQVDAVYPSGLVLPLATISPAKSSDWEAGTLVPLVAPLGLLFGQTATVALRLTAFGGSWDIDGISVDPYGRG